MALDDKKSDIKQISPDRFWSFRISKEPPYQVFYFNICFANAKSSAIADAIASGIADAIADVKNLANNFFAIKEAKLNIDTRINNDFFQHPKTLKLQKELGEIAPMFLIRLWVYASKFFPDGIIKDMGDDTLEEQIGWAGNHTGNFIQAIEKIGFIEKKDACIIIHDWEDHNPWASTEKSRKDLNRFNTLSRYYPQVSDLLRKNGIKAITLEQYKAIKLSSDPIKEATKIFKIKTMQNHLQSQMQSQVGSQMQSHCESKMPQIPNTHPIPSQNPSPNPKDIKNISHTKYSDNTKSEPPPKPAGDEIENQKGNIPDPENDYPSMEFVEFRDFYDRNVKPEGSHAGWIEFKKIKKASGPRGLEYFPGIYALMDDISKRLEDGYWDKGYEPGMAKYLNDRTWNQEVTSRQKPESERREQKTFAQIEEEREHERKQRLREKIKAMQEEGEKNAGL